MCKLLHENLWKHFTTRHLKKERTKLTKINKKAIGKRNSKLIKKNLYKFDLKTMLNEPQYFDLTETTKDQIFDKIIEGIPDNDTY